jgi:hypothetical protein
VGLLAVALVILMSAAPAHGDVSTDPGDYATIQEAIDDPVCTDVQLADQTFTESVLITRDLTVGGPGGGATLVQGRVHVAGAGTQVVLHDLQVQSSCIQPTLHVRAGAEVDGDVVEVVASSAAPCPAPPHVMFWDGFESGDTTAWSNAVGETSPKAVANVGPALNTNGE